jgi:hypothetical protein
MITGTDLTSRCGLVLGRYGYSSQYRYFFDIFNIGTVIRIGIAKYRGISGVGIGTYKNSQYLK